MKLTGMAVSLKRWLTARFSGVSGGVGDNEVAVELHDASGIATEITPAVWINGFLDDGDDLIDEFILAGAITRFIRFTKNPAAATAASTTATASASAAAAAAAASAAAATAGGTLVEGGAEV